MNPSRVRLDHMTQGWMNSPNQQTTLNQVTVMSFREHKPLLLPRHLEIFRLLGRFLGTCAFELAAVMSLDLP